MDRWIDDRRMDAWKSRLVDGWMGGLLDGIFGLIFCFFFWGGEEFLFVFAFLGEIFVVVVFLGGIFWGGN